MDEADAFAGFPCQEHKGREPFFNPIKTAEPGHITVLRPDCIFISHPGLSPLVREMLPLEIPGRRHNTAASFPAFPEGRFLSCRLGPRIDQQTLSRESPFHGKDRASSGPV